LALIFVLVLGGTVVATTVQIPWSSQHSSGLEGRTPQTFAAACDELGAALTEVDRDADQHSSCTTSNGHSIRCDWNPLEQRCVVECEGSIPIVDLVRHFGDGGPFNECDALRFMAYVPLVPRTATPAAAAGSSTTDAAMNAGM
jgi:hypothetical protein